VDLGEGRLKPQEVKLGLKGEDTYEVVEGLKPGDVVVTSGNFLIAAESRIRSATDFWAGDDHAGH
jgi:Cu(I)/Ag(I) efflux system membrane fusion protein